MNPGIFLRPSRRRCKCLSLKNCAIPLPKHTVYAYGLHLVSSGGECRPYIGVYSYNLRNTPENHANNTVSSESMPLIKPQKTNASQPGRWVPYGQRYRPLRDDRDDIRGPRRPARRCLTLLEPLRAAQVALSERG